ncbi:MAG: aminotransferase class IV [Sphaerochaetaceae bacterium]|jgi:branched-subunit amino acid aminotransferase/4-amino-4-deoxychorismate lyase
MIKHAIVNGHLVAAHEASLPISDREMQYGFGVYESLRVIQGKIVYPHQHIERLFFSAAGIGLRHHYTHDDVLLWMRQLLEKDSLQEATLRIVMLGGMEERLFITALAPTIYPESFYTQGVKAISYHGERFLPRYKTCALLMNYLALREAGSHGAFESLLVNSYGEVIEGTRSNIFACEENRLYTAPSELVLEGVTRHKVIEAAQQLGYSVIYESPKLKDLHRGRYSELFISSTSMGAMPISSFDGRIFSSPFEITSHIHHLIRQWEEDTLH